MTIKSLLFPSLYSAVYIAGVTFSFYGGHMEQINKASVIGWLLLVPFCVGAIFYSKKALYNNRISGRDAVKEGFQFVLLSTIILIAFQSFFFYAGFKDYKINFMQTHGVELAKLQIKNGNLAIKESEIPGLIQKEIEQITLFKEITSIIFKNLFLGIITAIITGVFIKGFSNPNKPIVNSN